MYTKQLLWFSALMLAVVGVAHSYLGERYVLSRLLALENLPLLYSDPAYTRRLIRMAWHITSVAWWGFALMLLVMAPRPVGEIRTFGFVLAETFLITAGAILLAGKLQHPGWPFFLLAAAATALAVK